MMKNPSRRAAAASVQAGVSLIELMIAMLLGLVVVAGASAVFMSNRQTYGSSETLNRIQENQRTSFELMSRDLREAGGSPCPTTALRRTVLRNAATAAWADAFGRGIVGYGAASSFPARAGGTDAIDIFTGTEGQARVIENDSPSAVTTVSDSSGIEVGDVVIMCNSDFALSFEVTHKPSGKIGHNAGGGGGNGNCEKITVAGCPAPPNSTYCFTPPASGSGCDVLGSSPAYLARLSIVRWFVAGNDRGGTSLYRAVLKRNGAATQVVSTDEIAEGVADMDITYLQQGSDTYVAAATVGAAWDTVTAVRVEMAFEGARGALRGADLQGTDGEVLQRTMTNIVTLRNREDLL